MNDDIEELLREGMERATRDLQAPAELMRLAVRRRRRKLELRSAAGLVAALTAAAVALVLVELPGGTMAPAEAASYVVQRAGRALSAAEPGEVAQMTVTTSVRTPDGKTATQTAEEWSYDHRWRLVTYSIAGRPIYDEGYNAASVYTLVSYTTRTWARQRALGPSGFAPPGPLAAGTNQPARHGCGLPAAAFPLLFRLGLPGLGPIPSSLPDTAATDLRSAVSCGSLAVAGRQRVDGIEAIKLTSRPGSPIPETIWVSPGTYLPVRVVTRQFPGYQGTWQTADITWLPPTAQNLAKLAVPIPGGFRRVRPAAAIQPNMLFIPGSPLAYAGRPCRPPGPASDDRTFGSGSAHRGHTYMTLLPCRQSPKSS